MQVTAEGKCSECGTQFDGCNEDQSFMNYLLTLAIYALALIPLGFAFERLHMFCEEILNPERKRKVNARKESTK